MARVELGDEALDRTALPSCVPALEDDAERRPELALADLASERQPELGEPGLSSLEPFLLLLLREVLGEIYFCEAAHLRTSGIGPSPLSARKPATAIRIRSMPAMTAMVERDA